MVIIEVSAVVDGRSGNVVVGICMLVMRFSEVMGDGWWLMGMGMGIVFWVSEVMGGGSFFYCGRDGGCGGGKRDRYRCGGVVEMFMGMGMGMVVGDVIGCIFVLSCKQYFYYKN